MRDARSFLETLGAPHPMTDGAIEWLHSLRGRIQDEPRAAAPPTAGSPD
jgi:hypothetical protein